MLPVWRGWSSTGFLHVTLVVCKFVGYFSIFTCPLFLQFECPSRDKEIYHLPDQIKAQVEDQYARDVARTNPAEAVRLDDEYNSFLKELGGGSTGSNKAEVGHRPQKPGW